MAGWRGLPGLGPVKTWRWGIQGNNATKLCCKAVPHAFTTPSLPGGTKQHSAPSYCILQPKGRGVGVRRREGLVQGHAVN